MSEMLRNLKTTISGIIRNSSKVFIVGHNEPDFDSIGSAMGLFTICKLLGRKAYIIVDDEETRLEPGVKKIIEENRKRFNIIDMSTFKDLFDKNSSLIITDANKDYLLSVADYLDDFKYKIIIDHHAEDAHTVETDYKFIEPQISSASEIVAQLLNSYRLCYPSTVANYLLAGIELDTNRYKKNTSSRTHDVAKKLILGGANQDYVHSLFLAEFKTDRRINDLVYNGSLFETYEKTIFQPRQVSFTLNRKSPAEIYKKEDLAKAADKMLDYDVDAAFVMGYLDDALVAVSARSKSDINVGDIMGKLGGGGNKFSAACKVITEDINEVEERIKSLLSESVFSPPEPTITEVALVGTVPERSPVKIKS